MSATHVVVAGASGVIGRALVPRLVAAGHAVVGLTRRPAAAAWLSEAGATPVVVDVYDAGALGDAMAAARPDVVLHQLTDLAGADVAANTRLRTVGTRNLVDAALAAGARRMIAQSTAWAYAPGDEPASEAEPLDRDATGARQTTVAGIVALEQAVQELAESVILHYGQLYGPGTWFAGDGARADDARAGRLAAGPDVASFVHVEDAATAAVSALDWPSGVVNVCDDEPAAGAVWVPAFCAAVGGPTPPAGDAPRTPSARGASNRRARMELGWVPA
jgi:nucleoside-diphosphate-sugar epimerase